VGAVDMSIRLPGANVAASGAGNSGTTSADAPTGSWALSLPEGSYTVTASMAGYVTGSRVCDVTVGGETWCSLGLEPKADVTPPAEKGWLVGVVYEAKVQGSTDMSVRLPGAWVSAAGPGASSASDVASGADAVFELQVPVGTWVVTASAPDHDAASRVCTVAANQDTWCSVGLQEAATVVPTGPTGVLKGVAYLSGPDGPADMSDRLPGTLVRALGPDGVLRERIAPFPDALWQLDVPVGTHRVTAVLAGYTAPEQQCDVVEGLVTWCSTGLTLGESVGPGPLPGGADGTLSGVVYELDGSGSTDMDTRLEGAIVTLTGAQGVAGALVANGTDAAWSKAVPPGNYFVVAALNGYLSSGRSCAVLSDQDTWCPLGLAPVDDGTTLPPGPDTVGADDAPAGPPDAAPTADGAGERDAVAGTDSGFSYSIDLHEEPASTEAAGCTLGRPSTPATTTGLVLLAGLSLLGVFRRRRARAAARLAVLVLLGLAPAALTAAPPCPGAPVRLTDVHAVTPAAGFTQPVWSPDGSRLAVAGPSYASLHLVDLATRTITRVAEGAGVGLAPLFSPAGDRLGVRAPGQRGHEAPLLAVTLAGAPTRPVANPVPGRWLRFEGDEAHVRVGTTEVRVSAEGERACCGTFGPGGRFAAWLGLSTGVHVHDTATGRTHALGAGTHPRFAADGRALLFDRCADDGTRLTACTLHLADLSGSAPVVRTIEGAPALATHPALSPDGRTLAFEVGGAVWVGTIAP
jgi:hypothetical protein